MGLAFIFHRTSIPLSHLGTLCLQLMVWSTNCNALGNLMRLFSTGIFTLRRLSSFVTFFSQLFDRIFRIKRFISKSYQLSWDHPWPYHQIHSCVWIFQAVSELCLTADSFTFQFQYHLIKIWTHQYGVDFQRIYYFLISALHGACVSIYVIDIVYYYNLKNTGRSPVGKLSVCIKLYSCICTSVLRIFISQFCIHASLFNFTFHPSFNLSSHLSSTLLMRLFHIVFNFKTILTQDGATLSHISF